MITSRRSFLHTLTGLIAAPAIIKVADLMPVKAPPLPALESPIIWRPDQGLSAIMGDVVWNDAPAVGQPIGWVCVGAGTPGVWREMPRLT